MTSEPMPRDAFHDSLGCLIEQGNAESKTDADAGVLLDRLTGSITIRFASGCLRTGNGRGSVSTRLGGGGGGEGKGERASGGVSYGAVATLSA